NAPQLPLFSYDSLLQPEEGNSTNTITFPISNTKRIRFAFTHYAKYAAAALIIISISAIIITLPQQAEKNIHSNAPIAQLKPKQNTKTVNPPIIKPNPLTHEAPLTAANSSNPTHHERNTPKKIRHNTTTTNNP